MRGSEKLKFWVDDCNEFDSLNREQQALVAIMILDQECNYHETGQALEELKGFILRNQAIRLVLVDFDGVAVLLKPHCRDWNHLFKFRGINDILRKRSSSVRPYRFRITGLSHAEAICIRELGTTICGHEIFWESRDVVIDELLEFARKNWTDYLKAT